MIRKNDYKTYYFNLVLKPTIEPTVKTYGKPYYKNLFYTFPIQFRLSIASVFQSTTVSTY